MDPKWQGSMFELRHSTEHLVTGKYIGVWRPLSLQHSPKRPSVGAGVSGNQRATEVSVMGCPHLPKTAGQASGTLRSQHSPPGLDLRCFAFLWPKIVASWLWASNHMTCSYTHVCVVSSTWTKLLTSWPFGAYPLVTFPPLNCKKRQCNSKWERLAYLCHCGSGRGWLICGMVALDLGGEGGRDCICESDLLGRIL